MKSFNSLLALMLFPIGLSIAQTQPATSLTQPTATTSSSTTRATSTATAPASANRQQELYDQYHGITKKSATAPPTATPNSTRTEMQQQSSEPAPARSTANVSRPQPMASDANTSSVRVGIRGGVTYPVFTKTQLYVDPAIGFVGGVTFNFGGGTLSFQPEVNYARYSEKGKGLFSGQTLATDVIEVPLFLKIASGTYAGSRFFVNVGPYGAYTASASIDGKKVDISSSNGRFSFGAAAGIGTALKAGPGHVTVEVRGLYPLGNSNDGFTTDNDVIFSQATLGYLFPLGGR